jgi:RNA polymerase sigma-70 factor (ECF subfamily)
MPESSLHTTQLRRWVQRMRDGDRAAREEMLRAVHARLERLARKMLRRFPDVGRWEQSDDLLQNAVLRLLRALQDVEPTSVCNFFGLAAEQMRRELLDLARRYRSQRLCGPSRAVGPKRSESSVNGLDPPAVADDPDDLDKWCAFHEAVERLPVEQREVVSLLYYHGWKQADVAEHLGFSRRTVQRHWAAAMLELHALLKDL